MKTNQVSLTIKYSIKLFIKKFTKYLKKYPLETIKMTFAPKWQKSNSEQFVSNVDIHTIFYEIL